MEEDPRDDREHRQRERRGARFPADEDEQRCGGEFARRPALRTACPGGSRRT
jgi:hypothetical protein